MTMDLTALSRRKGEDDDNLPSVRFAETPVPACVGSEAGGASPPLARSVCLQNVCKQTADKLSVPLPAVQAEAPAPRHERKRLPRAKRAARQLLSFLFLFGRKSHLGTKPSQLQTPCREVLHLTVKTRRARTFKPYIENTISERGASVLTKAKVFHSHLTYTSQL